MSPRHGRADEAPAPPTPSAPPAPSAPPGASPRAGRRQQRAEALRRRQRRRLVAAIACGLVAVLAVIVVAVVRAPGRHQAKAPAPRTGRSQATVLFQLRGPDGMAVGSALLAHDPISKRGTAVLVPSQVIAEVPGAGSQPFGQALLLPGRDLPSEALADLMGVTVDQSWVLDLPTLTTLVDRIGGVPMDVDRDVLAPQPDGSARIVVAAGPRQRLGGAAATAYATYLGAGEQETDRLPRLQKLVQGLLGGLPGSAPAVQSTITALGPGSVPSAPAALAPLVVGLITDLRADALPFNTLPVLPIDTGAGSPSYRIDAPAVRSLVDRELADSVPSGVRAGGNRVLVLNGVGTPGTGDQVRARLVTGGLVYVGSRNAPNFDYPTSQVLIFDATPAARALAQRVATALGLPPTSVGISTQAQSVADVIVVVGADFKP